MIKFGIVINVARKSRQQCCRLLRAVSARGLFEHMSKDILRRLALLLLHRFIVKNNNNGYHCELNNAVPKYLLTICQQRCSYRFSSNFSAISCNSVSVNLSSPSVFVLNILVHIGPSFCLPTICMCRCLTESPAMP